ncbi:DegT/DnrJ/EryC1/StrS family aminotransferase [Dermatophilus congolensis]|uniref:DegT/DnrJ/EryC1/StrS family aminotransferase n=1 Tax=Dermatophilus congolensis TaxID=1863 RepID=UPI001AAFFDAC
MNTSSPDSRKLLPFIPFGPPDIGEEEVRAAAEAIRSGWLTTGPAAAAFETEFAAALAGNLTTTTPGTPAPPTASPPPDIHAVAVNSATAGLHLALVALGIGPGDEVIVPTWTFTSTAEVVRYVGATPVLVDVLPTTLNIDLHAAAAAITPHTRAIMPVHFAGLPIARTHLAEFAREHNLAVIEDAAHAFPAVSENINVGLGASEAVVFSFYATKTMTTGEGGMLLTTNPDLANHARMMRLHGISRDAFSRYTESGMSAGPAWKYEVLAPGFKYNLTDPAAAIGRVQLTKAIRMRTRREEIAHAYDEAFADLPLQLPPHAPSGDIHARHIYAPHLLDTAPIQRDTLIDKLTNHYRIGASVHFIPLHRHPVWRDTIAPDPTAFPVAEDAFSRCFSLPIFSAMTDEQIDRVITAVRQLCGAHS